MDWNPGTPYLSLPLSPKEPATERDETSGSKKEDMEDMWAPEAIGKTEIRGMGRIESV